MKLACMYTQRKRECVSLRACRFPNFSSCLQLFVLLGKLKSLVELFDSLDSSWVRQYHAAFGQWSKFNKSADRMI